MTRYIKVITTVIFPSTACLEMDMYTAGIWDMERPKRTTSSPHPWIFPEKIHGSSEGGHGGLVWLIRMLWISQIDPLWQQLKGAAKRRRKTKTKEPPGCLGKKQQLENTSSDTYHGSTKKLFSLAYSYLIFLRERALCVAGPQHRQLLWCFIGVNGETQHFRWCQLGCGHRGRDGLNDGGPFTLCSNRRRG